MGGEDHICMTGAAGGSLPGGGVLTKPQLVQVGTQNGIRTAVAVSRRKGGLYWVPKGLPTQNETLPHPCAGSRFFSPAFVVKRGGGETGGSLKKIKRLTKGNPLLWSESRSLRRLAGPLPSPAHKSGVNPSVDWPKKEKSTYLLCLGTGRKGISKFQNKTRGGGRFLPKERHTKEKIRRRKE